MVTKEKYHLLNNSRFYILACSLLVSISVFAWLRLSIDSDQLLLIRSQQVYGLIALAFWYVALIISPLGYVIGKHRIKHVEFSRRAIGVSAFYFAFLHTMIALFGQLGGLERIQYLPDLFKWSLFSGAIALFVLGVMAATSFDRVIRFMTFRKWKWLHRLVYIAGVLVILHIWIIGTHLAYREMQIIGFIALALLSGLEVLRIAKQVNKKRSLLNRSELAAATLAVWSVILILIVALPFWVQNFHTRHKEHHTSQEIR